MPLLLVALTLAASNAPLKVRVLQREKPYQAVIAASALSCDGAKLPATQVSLHLKDQRLQANDQLCDTVSAEGEVRITLEDRKRPYPGRLTAVAEGAFIRFIDEVDVEEYLPGVVASQVENAPAAALEVQAVVGRTFALASRNRHKDDGYDLCDLPHCQGYRGRDEVPREADDAVKRTRGEVLLWGGIGLKPAWSHAACGGHTSRATEVFGDGAEGVGPGVSDTGKEGAACRDAPDFKWTFDIERTEMARALGLNPEGSAFEPLRRDEAGRVLELKAFNKRFRGDEFMAAMGRAFGAAAVKSMKVSAEEVDSLIRFTGVGVGHGVGLCQQGARAMAAKGMGKKQILQKYFPDCQVRVP